MIRKKLRSTPRSPVSADIEMGKCIKTRRIINKMSQEELATILSVSFQQVRKYEKGINRVNANRLGLIASALKMPLEELYPSSDMSPGVF